MTADSCWPSSPVAVSPWISCCALPATTLHHQQQQVNFNIVKTQLATFSAATQHSCSRDNNTEQNRQAASTVFIKECLRMTTHTRQTPMTWSTCSPTKNKTVDIFWNKMMTALTNEVIECHAIRTEKSDQSTCGKKHEEKMLPACFKYSWTNIEFEDRTNGNKQLAYASCGTRTHKSSQVSRNFSQMLFLEFMGSHTSRHHFNH